MDFRNIKMYSIDMLSITQFDIKKYVTIKDALQGVGDSMQTVEVIRQILVVRELKASLVNFLSCSFIWIF